MKLVLLLAAALYFAVPGEAQVVSKRQGRQQARIAEGVKSGELSKEEAAKLNRRQGAIRRQTMRDRVDGGGLTPAERARANRKLNRQSKQIHKKKNNDEKNEDKQ